MQNPHAEPANEFALSPRYETEYAEIVKPDRVIVIPGYALRLMQHGDLTPKEMSLWVAFRQAVYFSWSQEKSGKTVSANIPHRQITNFAMMSRASFFREVTGQPSICGGLVELDDAPADPYATRQIANSLRYKVSMQPRLTRRDCGIIHAIIAGAIAGHDGEEAFRRAEKILADMAAQSPGVYLDNPRAKVSQLDGWPRNVTEIVRRALSVTTLPELLRQMADNLQERILAGYGKVVVTHYFLQTVAPALNLSHAQAWTVITLRDRVWFDYSTGERWPFAIIHGGLDELAAMTGSTVKSVRNWLDDPGFTELVAAQRTPAPVELPEYWDTRTLVFYVDPIEPIFDIVDDDSEEKMSTDQGKSEYRSGKKRVTIREKVSNDSGKSEYPLNNFYNRYLNLYNRRHLQNAGKSETPSTPAAADLDFEKNQGDANSREKPQSRDWSLEDLVRTNTINPKKLREMNERQADPRALAQWIADAFRKPNLTNPIGLAVQNTIDYPWGREVQKSAFGRHSRKAILSGFARVVAGYPLSSLPEDIAALVRGMSKPAIKNLYLSLGGDESDIPGAYVPPAPAPTSVSAPAIEEPTPVEIPEDILRRGEELLARVRKK